MRTSLLPGILAAGLLVGISVPALAQSSPGQQPMWGSSTTVSSGACNPAVAKALAQRQQQAVADATALAAQIYQPMPKGGYNSTSCLGNLFQGVSILFSPPNFGQIAKKLEGAAEQAVCSMTTQLVQQAEQPLNNAINQVSSAASSATSLGTGSLGSVGDFLPGLNLGSTGMGISIGQTSGQGPLTLGVGNSTSHPLGGGSSSILSNASSTAPVPAFGSLLSD